MSNSEPLIQLTQAYLCTPEKLLHSLVFNLLPVKKSTEQGLNRHYIGLKASSTSIMPARDGQKWNWSLGNIKFVTFSSSGIKNFQWTSEESDDADFLRATRPESLPLSAWGKL